jgi:hypothetical protein
MTHKPKLEYASVFLRQSKAPSHRGFHALIVALCAVLDIILLVLISAYLTEVFDFLGILARGILFTGAVLIVAFGAGMAVPRTSRHTKVLLAIICIAPPVVYSIYFSYAREQGIYNAWQLQFKLCFGGPAPPSVRRIDDPLIFKVDSDGGFLTEFSISAPDLNAILVHRQLRPMTASNPPAFNDPISDSRAFHFGDNDELFQFKSDIGGSATLRVNREHTLVLLHEILH